MEDYEKAVCATDTYKQIGVGIYRMYAAIYHGGGCSHPTIARKHHCCCRSHLRNRQLGKNYCTSNHGVAAKFAAETDQIIKLVRKCSAISCQCTEIQAKSPTRSYGTADILTHRRFTPFLSLLRCYCRVEGTHYAIETLQKLKFFSHHV